MARSLIHWQRAAGNYWPFVCAAPFLGSLPDRPNLRTRPSCLPALAAAAEAGPGEINLALFVDLPPSLTLPASPALNQLGFAVVPVIQRWPERPAELRCDPLLEQPVAYGQELQRPRRARGVVFLLDSQRGAQPGSSARPRRHSVAFDNRYLYKSDRFPSASFFQHEGVQLIRWLGASGDVPTDLGVYLLGLQRSGSRLEVLSAATSARA